jgi:hypothetical protein
MHINCTFILYFYVTYAVVVQLQCYVEKSKQLIENLYTFHFIVIVDIDIVYSENILQMIVKESNNGS